MKSGDGQTPVESLVSQSVILGLGLKATVFGLEAQALADHGLGCDPRTQGLVNVTVRMSCLLFCWNNTPLAISSQSSLQFFKCHLKTHYGILSHKLFHPTSDCPHLRFKFCLTL